jgi:SHS2 domain-containing protein
MSFELRPHTADVAVEARGSTLGAAFAAVADGMAAAMCEDVPVEGGDRFEITERAESREALLYEYLDRLIIERDVRRILPVDHDATVTETDGGFTVTASARGVPFDAVAARDLKAVTYADMAIERVRSGWRAYVVFDV